uniref:Chromosome partitioning protein n=1 Tax=Parafrankia colletiae TaxID=573497 RepID=A0A1S1QXG4_9ACTN
MERRRPFPRPRRRRIITVANQKGGVGKTTTTVNLAAALAMHGIRVLVVDLDPQGNASTALGVDHRSGTPSIYEVLVGDRPLDEIVVQSGEAEGLFCAPATIDLAGAEIELVSLVARETRLRRAIEGMRNEVDYVLIDCPPSLGLLTVNALVAARELLIPIQCEYYALEGLGQLLRNVELVQAHLNQELRLSTILLTMYDSRTRLADQVVHEVKEHFGDRVLNTTIPRNVRLAEAPSYGQSVLTYDPASRGSLSYLAAARELAERGAAAPRGAAVPPERETPPAAGAPAPSTAGAAPAPVVQGGPLAPGGGAPSGPVPQAPGAMNGHSPAGDTASAGFGPQQPAERRAAPLPQFRSAERRGGVDGYAEAAAYPSSTPYPKGDGYAPADAYSSADGYPTADDYEAADGYPAPDAQPAPDGYPGSGGYAGPGGPNLNGARR